MVFIIVIWEVIQQLKKMPPSKSTKYFLVKRLINRICTRKASFRVLLGIPMLCEVISTWMFNKYLKFNLFKTDLLIISHLVPPVAFLISINSNSILQTFRPKTSVIFDFFHLLIPLAQSIRRACFLYFKTRSRITRSTATTLVQVTILSPHFCIASIYCTDSVATVS